MEKALIVFGPSGVGKSTIAKWIAEDLDFLQYEADLSCIDVDGINYHRIRKEWDEYHDRKQPKKLYETLIDRCKHLKLPGTVLSLPSLCPDFNLMQSSKSVGLHSVVLFAKAKECEAAFMGRDLFRKFKGNSLAASDYWKQHNVANKSFAEMEQSKYDQFRIWTRANNNWRDRREVISEIKTLLVS